MAALSPNSIPFANSSTQRSASQVTVPGFPTVFIPQLTQSLGVAGQAPAPTPSVPVSSTPAEIVQLQPAAIVHPPTSHALAVAAAVAAAAAASAAASPSSDIQLEQIGPVVPGPGAKREEDKFSLRTLSATQQDRVQRAKKYALEQSIKSILVKQTITHQQQQMQSFQVTVQRQQALALMCRIYVGSINYDVPETALRTAFSPFGPVKSLSMPFDSVTNKHKGFAFIEYEVPESAALAVEQMNSVIMGGRNIKVGRPTNMPQALAIIQQLAQEAQQFNRIFVASVHPELAERDLQSVFEAFGRVRSVQLAADPQRPGKHRGFGFIEYESKQASEDACQSMNLFDLGGQFLRVGRAVTPPNCGANLLAAPAQAPTSLPSAAAIAAATITAKIHAMEATPAPVVSPKATVSPRNNSGLSASLIVGPPASLPPPQVVIPSLSTLSPGRPTVGTPVNEQATLYSATSFSEPGLASAAPLPAATIVVPPTATAVAAVAAAAAAAAPKVETLAEKILSGKLSSGESIESIEAEEGQNVKVKGREARHLIMQKLMRQQEFRVVVMRNMVGPEDLDPELENEVTEECGKYGDVRKVIIYQEKQGHEDDAPIVVKIFVEFSAQADAESAIQALNGRWFGGRMVRAEKYDQYLYDQEDFSG